MNNRLLWIRIVEFSINQLKMQEIECENLMLVSVKRKIWKSDESWIVRIVRIMRAEMELLCTLSIP